MGTGLVGYAGMDAGAGVSTDSHRHPKWKKKCGAFGSEMQVLRLGNAGPSARRLNSFAAQQRRGEFCWLSQDDNVLCFSELSWFLYVIWAGVLSLKFVSRSRAKSNRGFFAYHPQTE
jgi:hypothetical protein